MQYTYLCILLLNIVLLIYVAYSAAMFAHVLYLIDTKHLCVHFIYTYMSSCVYYIRISCIGYVHMHCIFIVESVKIFGYSSIYYSLEALVEPKEGAAMWARVLHLADAKEGWQWHVAMLKRVVHLRLQLSSLGLVLPSASHHD